MAKRLTDFDKDFIRENYTILTDKKMAESIGCSTRTVERFRGIEKLNKNPEKIVVSKKEDTEDENFFKNKLLSSPRGRRVKELLSYNDWEKFIDEWVNYHVQLEDLTFTEENTIEQIIILNIRIDKNQRDYKYNSEVKDVLSIENNISDIKDLDLKDPAEAEIYEKIYTASIRMTDLNKEYKELLDKNTKLQEALNVTRKQREETGRVGADTFFALCKKFEDKKYREKESRTAELLRIATEKNKDNLRNGIEYMDGEIAPQLLDSTTIDRMEDKNE